MNIFIKSEVSTVLTKKVSSGEIKSFKLTDDHLRIQKSKRTGFTLKLKDITDKNLLRLLKKTTPSPSIQNIEDFYIKKLEILKIS
jgi:hypothetical protein